MPYATQTDLERMGGPPGMFADLDAQDIEDALERASFDADSALRGAGYRTPLSTWSKDLTGIVVDIAVWYLMKRRGYNPELGADAVIEASYKAANAKLKEISNRALQVALCTEPPAPDPAPAAVAERGASIVRTTSKRGW